MLHNKLPSPFCTADYIHQPANLRQTLLRHGALKFSPYDSGLFPASDISEALGSQTGMDMAWFRDNAHVAMALHENDSGAALAAPAGLAMLRILDSNRDLLDEVVFEGSERRLLVRADGRTLQKDSEPRVQHDSTGYLMWCTSQLMRDMALYPRRDRLDNLAQTARYLECIEYWQAADHGHWEESSRIHVSSIMVCIAGLRSLQSTAEQFGYETDIDFNGLIENGEYAYKQILNRGVTELLPDGSLPQPIAGRLDIPQTVNSPEATATLGELDIDIRRYDAALLFGVVPLNVFDDEHSVKIVHDIERNLVRSRGVARYLGDTYWGPRFKDILKPTERTQSAPGRLAQRDQTAEGVAYTQTEAQWTLFDPLLSVYWAREYAKTGHKDAREKQMMYLDRSLSQLACQPDGSYNWPENYYYELDLNADKKFQLKPNDHTPLLWTQANVLRALREFRT